MGLFPENSYLYQLLITLAIDVNMANQYTLFGL